MPNRDKSPDVPGRPPGYAAVLQGTAVAAAVDEPTAGALLAAWWPDPP